MASFDTLNFNDGTSVKIGFVTSFWGLNGFNPIETVKPNGLNIAKYKKRIQDKYNSNVQGAINVINNVTYTTYDNAMQSLNEVADTLIDNVYWLYGDLYTGGCFIW